MFSDGVWLTQNRYRGNTLYAPALGYFVAVVRVFSCELNSGLFILADLVKVATSVAQRISREDFSQRPLYFPFLAVEVSKPFRTAWRSMG